MTSRPVRGMTPRHVRGHKIALLVMLFCCVSARVERGDLPDMLLKKMGNVIVCYADWSECDEKVFYLLSLSLSLSLSLFLSLSLSHTHTHTHKHAHSLHINSQILSPRLRLSPSHK